jgi:hypothetical protein
MSTSNRDSVPDSTTTDSSSGQNTDRTSVSEVNTNGQGETGGDNVTGTQDATILSGYLQNETAPDDQVLTWHDSSVDSSTPASRTQ